MITRTTEDDLVRQATNLATQARAKVEGAGLQISDFSNVAALFDVEVVKGKLPTGSDGSYDKDHRLILLGNGVGASERDNFSFCHELMHALIEDDNDILSEFADAYRRADEAAMERMCNAGAAELLIPQKAIAHLGCSVALIPTLCERFAASSIAVALQMIQHASDWQYLIISELQEKQGYATLFEPAGENREQLAIIYSARSRSAKYIPKRRYDFPHGHGMYAALKQPGVVLTLQADVPIGDKPWPLQCECIYFRRKVFALFRERIPYVVSSDQKSLW